LPDSGCTAGSGRGQEYPLLRYQAAVKKPDGRRRGGGTKDGEAKESHTATPVFGIGNQQKMTT